MSKTPARRTAPHIAVIDGQPTTTSRDIAETFGKRHDHVLDRIRKLDCSPEFNAPNFRAVEYTDAKGEQRTEYRITRDGFAFLCMGFTGARAAQWKEKYIATFNRLAERVAAKAAPQPRATAKALPAPGVDVLALLLGGQCTPEHVYPPEIERAIDKQAWALARDAYDLLREHMRRRVAYRHVFGAPVRKIDTVGALADIKNMTLGHALAHTAVEEMRYALSGARIAAQGAAEAAERIKAQIAELTKNHEGGQS